jgi:hypothetical protein
MGMPFNNQTGSRCWDVVRDVQDVRTRSMLPYHGITLQAGGDRAGLA